MLAGPVTSRKRVQVAISALASDISPEEYRAEYSRADGCLVKDRDALLAFYGFPAEHRYHFVLRSNTLLQTYPGLRS
ncbi:hypothetical protein GCM10007857_89630 [Bradyrhizobium iriomotense]|uniref:Uncharacterized protein n=1 Tax=Bradyrhizobium iriomotense TaxID=441950 RepID=A0ABQ6BD51_9BRAD|nr:hypothetical protein GCM10007857_89630 [Bradyrhizobium iriomotense]